MKVVRRGWIAAALAATLVAGFATAADAQVAAGAASKDLVLKGDAKCTRCHDESEEYPVLDIGRTRHGVTADQRTPTCTSCHGESDRHINKPEGVKERPKPDRSFARGTKHSDTPPEAQSGACLTCHERSTAHVFWQGSAHDRARVTCSSCHTVHATRDQVLVKPTQVGVCFTCHKDQRAAMFRFSSHPLRTGQMACSSCHQPHGSAGDHNLVRNTINETCYTCHAEKRGPFLHEHPPVREECTNCHNPHGTNNPQMLTARQPYLCQQCHVAPFHPSTLYSGNNLPPAVGADKMLGQQCANCHSQVHGSNHPSGQRFTR
jgi:DmsE family decaheme c-type cytochrome